MKINRQTIQVKSYELLAKIKEIIAEGNTKSITILDSNGKNVLEIPLTVGVGAGFLGLVMSQVFAPIIITVGVLAGIASNYSLVIDKIDKEKIVNVQVKTTENSEK